MKDPSATLECTFNSDIPTPTVHNPIHNNDLTFSRDKDNIIKLKEEITQLEILEKHVKGENENLKENNHKILK